MSNDGAERAPEERRPRPGGNSETQALIELFRPNRQRLDPERAAATEVWERRLPRHP